MLRNIKMLLVCLVGICCYSIGFAEEPSNLGLLRQEVIRYHDAGQYDKDIQKVIWQARDILQQEIFQNKENNNRLKLALVLDIDETSISSYNENVKDGFFLSPRLKKVYCYATNLPAIKPTLALYNFAKQNKISVFFITARKDECRNSTTELLRNAGYKNWDGLFTRKSDDKMMFIENYKSKMRKKISDKGYYIVLNMGDQRSDLIGGYAKNSLKLPNPYYFIP